METIIYTNNKRESSNYSSDRIVFTDGIDISQLIFNEIEKYHLRNIHLWFVRENLVSLQETNEQQLLIAIGRHISHQNNHSKLKIQYIAQRYACVKKCQKLKYMNIVSQQSIDMKEDQLQVGQQEQCFKERDDSMVKEVLIKEEIVFKIFKEFERFITEEVENNKGDGIIKKYVFEVNQGTIGVSFISKEKNELLEYIVDKQNDQFYNARLNETKIQAIHPKYSHPPQPLPSPTPVQTYHKLILYLFINRQQLQPIAKLTKQMSITKQKLFQTNISCLLSIQPWKLKQQINILVKLEKDCNLIKQQMQNQKLIFRNKIKVIENYIGDNINVERLYAQEEDNQPNNQGMNKKINQVLIGSFTAISQLMSNSDKFNRNQISCEFKRLKEMSDAIRSIDNVIYEQNIRRQSLLQKTKQLQKSKEELLYRHCKEINKVKYSLVDLQNEIKRKQLQIAQKTKSGYYDKIDQYKSKQPTSNAAQNLQTHISFLSQQANSLHNQPNTQAHSRSTTTNITINEQFGRMSSGSAYLRLKQKKNELALKCKQKLNQTGTDSIASQSLDQSQLLLSSNSLKPSHLDPKTNKKGHLADKIQIFGKQLLNLHKYYSNNVNLIKAIRQQVDNYGFVRHPSSNKKYANSKNMVIKSKNQFDFLLHEPAINMESLPLLQKMLNQHEGNSLNIQLDTSNVKEITRNRRVKQETFYNKNCFDMLFCKNKNKGSSLEQEGGRFGIVHKQIIQSKGKKSEQSEHFLKDSVIEDSEVKNILAFDPKMGRLKRTTIEETVSFGLKEASRTNLIK